MNTNLAEVIVESSDNVSVELKTIELHELAYVGGGAGMDTMG